MSSLVELMNGAMEQTIPPAHKMGIAVAEMLGGVIALATFDPAKY